MKPKIRVDRNGIRDPHWERIAQDISNYCIDNYGLSYPEVHFHFVDLKSLAGVVAAQGFPVHPETWQLEQEFNQIYLTHKYGNSKIFEIVSAAGGRFDDFGGTKEPIDAYIYDVDSDIQTKLVISHVFGHTHMDVNNHYGLQASAAVGIKSPHAAMVKLTEMVEECYKAYGMERVIELLDTVDVLTSLVAMETNVNPHKDSENWAAKREFESIEVRDMFGGLNKPLEDRLKQLLKEPKKMIPQGRVNNIFDVLESNALLKSWERQLVNKYRRIKQYQRAVVGPIKIVHEGFASFIHTRFGMENFKHVPMGELRTYMNFCAMNMGHNGGKLNPYALGFALLQDIFVKWGEGRHGIGYDRCNDWFDRLNWGDGMDVKKGWDKVLEVVAQCSDYDLIHRHFDMEFFQKNAKDFFTVGKADTGDAYVYYIESKKFKDVKNMLLFQQSNSGSPYFYVPPDGANFQGRNELMVNHDLRNLPKLFGHHPSEFTLDADMLKGVLQALHGIWRRPVHIKTINEEGNRYFVSFNGKKFKYRTSFD